MLQFGNFTSQLCGPHWDIFLAEWIHSLLFAQHTAECQLYVMTSFKRVSSDGSGSVKDEGNCLEQLQPSRQLWGNERHFINHCWNAASFPLRPDLLNSLFLQIQELSIQATRTWPSPSWYDVQLWVWELVRKKKRFPKSRQLTFQSCEADVAKHKRSWWEGAGLIKE